MLYKYNNTASNHTKMNKNIYNNEIYTYTSKTNVINVKYFMGINILWKKRIYLLF